MDIWHWADTEGSQTNEDLMSSSFSEYKILFYLVRESTQNTIDAWLERYQKKEKEKEKNPAIIKFLFNKHDTDLSKWFSGLREARKVLDDKGEHGSRYSTKLDYKNPNVLIIQDLNTGGILGDLKDTTSDFWNFLLHWGRSNKRSSSLSLGGSKGAGRVSFPLSSKTQCVFNITKRDDGTHLSGFALLNTCLVGNDFKDSFALCSTGKKLKGPDILGTTWELHDDATRDQFIQDFGIHDLKPNKATGTALVIPLPRDGITENDQHYERIKAAYIENYAPLIIRNHLQPWAGNEILKDGNIIKEAAKVEDFFQREDFRASGVEFIRFCRDSVYEFNAGSRVIELDLDEWCDLDKFQLSESQKQEISNDLANGHSVLFRIKFLIVKNGKKEKTLIEAAFSRPSKDAAGNYKQGVEIYYRNGMSMMNQPQLLQASGLHATLFCHDQAISRYLNLFEDEGHSKWGMGELEKENALKEGYDKEYYLRPVRLCRRTLKILHQKFVDEVQEKDTTTLSQFFSFPKKTKINPPVGPTGPIKKGIKAYKITNIKGGFRVKQNPKAPSSSFPPNGIKILASFKSEPMLRGAAYKQQDFDFGTLPITAKNCQYKGNGNELVINSCTRGFEVKVTGFEEGNRELTIRDSIY